MEDSEVSCRLGLERIYNGRFRVQRFSPTSVPSQPLLSTTKFQVVEEI